MVKRSLLLILLFPVAAFSQLAMQDWRIHFSISNTIGIAETDDFVYMACANGIVEYGKDDQSLSQLTSTNGLSDLGVSAIDARGNLAIIGYSNGNLDIIEGNTITNVPWIKTAELSGEKTISAFYFDDDIIYIASGIGLILLDNSKKEIRDTYYPYDNPVIKDVTIFQDTLYVTTPQGIYYAHKDKSFLNDKNQWNKLTTVLPSYLANQEFQELETYGDKLVFSYNSSVFGQDSIYFIQNGAFNKFATNPREVRDLKLDDNKLLLATYGGIDVLDDTMGVEFNIWQLNGQYATVESALMYNGEFWAADSKNGMVKALNAFNSDVIFANTPYADGSYRIDIQFGNVLVAGGGLTHNQQPNYFSNGIYRLRDESWTNFNYENQDSIQFGVSFDFISVAVNPNNTDEIVFGSSSEQGLMMVRDGQTVTEVFDQFNSTLEEFGGRYVITDLKYDSDGNLWITNTGQNPLKMMTPDGIWYEFSMGSAAKNAFPYRLVIDSEGTKWVSFKSVGLVAFNDGGTFDDISDDELKQLGTSEGFGNLPSAFPKSIAQDIDGEMWIGTETGLVVLYNTSNIFTAEFGEYDANPILIEVDGEVEKLLGESDITAIAIDGGNRKWIGTSSSGIFCLSDDGTEEIYRFTTENSPLISDNIFDIRMDYLSGEVFIATESGLVSVRTDASLGDPEFSDVTVFPNPVRPEHTGPITIQGLGYESDVKITDVSGNVVYRTTSNGGTVIWDGNTLRGQRAKSGVYFVWAASSNEKGRKVAKVVLIN
jgi:ligand-binding sensor domain-containing protein